MEASSPPYLSVELLHRARRYGLSRGGGLGGDMALLGVEYAVYTPRDEREQKIEARLATDAPSDAVPVVHRSKDPRVVTSRNHGDASSLFGFYSVNSW